MFQVTVWVTMFCTCTGETSPMDPEAAPVSSESWSLSCLRLMNPDIEVPKIGDRVKK